MIARVDDTRVLGKLILCSFCKKPQIAAVASHAPTQLDPWKIRVFFPTGPSDLAPPIDTFPTSWSACSAHSDSNFVKAKVMIGAGAVDHPTVHGQPTEFFVEADGGRPSHCVDEPA